MRGDLGVTAGTIHPPTAERVVQGITVIPTGRGAQHREHRYGSWMPRTLWAQLSGPHPEHEWLLREHIEIPGAKWRPIKFEPTSDPLLSMFDGAHDLFDGRSMILLPTPGHTPGSLSMLVRTEGAPPVLLVGDLAYGAGLIRRGQVPGTGDETLLRQSYARVCALMDQLPGLIIVPAHDDEGAQALEAAFGRA